MHSSERRSAHLILGSQRMGTGGGGGGGGAGARQGAYLREALIKYIKEPSK